ncbi:hypothetical protein [Albibacterium bauzanense]|uniref:Uncharacterized protein n=1 Tax=Albibacterium bauzanense TaxID=653929 RepID=A0A4R1M292_9SPHI|nr:hypothetical protein [Albibacterium bauzanense]TCK84954.1 hypothetical protein C8N28_0250 [Albibacterium bauzanense]
MDEQQALILVQLLKNEAATLSLAKSLMTEEEFAKYLEMYRESFNLTLNSFKDWFPGMIEKES